MDTLIVKSGWYAKSPGPLPGGHMSFVPGRVEAKLAPISFYAKVEGQPDADPGYLILTIDSKGWNTPGNKPTGDPLLLAAFVSMQHLSRWFNDGCPTVYATGAGRLGGPSGDFMFTYSAGTLVLGRAGFTFKKKPVSNRVAYRHFTRWLSEMINSIIQHNKGLQ